MAIGEKLQRIIKNSDSIYGSGYMAGQSNGLTIGYQRGYDEAYPAGIQLGYRNGKKDGAEDERRAFWRIYQQEGKRTNYQTAFAGFGFDFDNFYPMFDIRPTQSCATMFFGWNKSETQKGSLRKRLLECNVELDTSQTTNLSQTFYNCYFTDIPTIVMPGGVDNKWIFANNPYLTLIDGVIVEENTVFTGCFKGNTALEQVIFHGVIGQDGLDVSDCIHLNKDSIQSIVECLKDYSGDGTTHTVTLGAENLAKLTAQEIANARAKGWKLV